MPRKPERAAQAAPAGAGMTLRDLQRWMLDAIVMPNRTDTEARRRLAEARPADDVVVPSPTRTSAERMAIYSDMYFLRLHSVFESEYPGLRGLMDDDAFDHMVRDYLSHYPPRSYAFWDLGAALANYFATRRDLPDLLLADMARLEYAIRCAIHEPESAVLTPDALSTLPPEQFAEVRFRPANGFRVLAFGHDVNALFDAIDRGAPPPDRGPKPAWTAVWRKDLTVWRQGISRPMFAILSALAAGKPMGVAIEAGAELWEGDESVLEASIFEWFADWLGEGFFSAIVLPSR